MGLSLAFFSSSAAAFFSDFLGLRLGALRFSKMTGYEWLGGRLWYLEDQISVIILNVLMNLTDVSTVDMFRSQDVDWIDHIMTVVSSSAAATAIYATSE